MGIVGLVILGLSSTIEAKPTCDEPTCGGTREVAGAPPAEGEGEEGEEKADPCSEDPYSSWRNFLAWSKFCEDGTVGYFDPEMPPGKIGQPAEEEEKWRRKGEQNRNRHVIYNFQLIESVQR